MQPLDFSNMDKSIYEINRRMYLPSKINFLFVAESPPAFFENEPTAFFYFENVAKADLLFYTLVKAIYDLDFGKGIHDRVETLRRFQSDGYYLLDSVEYPINKTRDRLNVSNSEREKIIASRKWNFEQEIQKLIDSKHICDTTTVILIKETVYNQHRDNPLLRVANKRPIGFPRYVKDHETINAIRALIKK